MPPASGWRTPSTANVMASGTDSASSAAHASTDAGPGDLGGERGEDQDARAEHGADVEGGGGAGGQQRMIRRSRGMWCSSMPCELAL